VNYSSISITTFAELILRIKNFDDYDNFICNHLTFETVNQSEQTISNTITTFKYLKKYLIKNLTSKTSKDNINHRLMTYMSDVFKDKNKGVSCDIATFSLFIHQNNWEKTEINLYNLFERYNLMKYKQRSFALKKKILNDVLSIHTEFNPRYNYITVGFLINLCDIADSKPTKLYVVYEMYKYMNYFLENNIKSSSLNKKTFQLASVEKAEEFLKQIQNDFATILPKYFKDLLIDELTKYKKLAVNATL
jgi:hypothetical protein